VSLPPFHAVFWLPMATLPCDWDALSAVAGASAAIRLPLDQLPAAPARLEHESMADPDHRACFGSDLAKNHVEVVA
jgi:hypothetical protein